MNNWHDQKGGEKIDRVIDNNLYFSIDPSRVQAAVDSTPPLDIIEKSTQFIKL